MLIIYCEGCHAKVAKIETGSKIKSKAVMLCDDCETKRKALELRFRSLASQSSRSGKYHKPDKTMNEFMDLFKTMY